MPDPDQSTTMQSQNAQPHIEELLEHQTAALPQSLALIPAGLEVVPDTVDPGKETVQAEKEVISQEEKEAVQPAIQPDGWHTIWQGPKMSRKICGIRADILIALLISLAVIFALGAGLGIGLHKKALSRAAAPDTSAPASSSSTAAEASPTSAQYRTGGSIDASYYSQQGAWNGTGIALSSQSLASNILDAPLGSLVLYVQHHSGDIRFMRLNSSGEWVGGSKTEVVASNARNSTPISTVSYVINGTSAWHVFYIDTYNHIQQRSNSNATGFWTDGPIRTTVLRPYASDLVGLQTCWDRSGEKEGMRIWHAADDTTFREYSWYVGDHDWSWERDWTGYSGAAGVGCYSWGEDGSSYVALVDLENNLELWYRNQTNEHDDKDLNQGSASEYLRTNVSIPGVYAASFLTYTSFLYAQMAKSLDIKGYNVSWSGNTTNVLPNDTFSVADEPGLPGTHFSATSLPTTSGGYDLCVFFQTDGDDITEYVRASTGGSWSEVSIPIPAL